MNDSYILTIPERIAALRQEMAANSLDAFLVPRHDAHQGEYVAARDARLAWLTGFTGSAGIAVVLADTVAVFADGRYTVQLRQQCPVGIFEHHHSIDDPVEAWLARSLKSGQRIGFDGMLTSTAFYDRLRMMAEAGGIELLPVEANPVDAVWRDQPGPPMGRITAFPQQFSGRSATDKLGTLQKEMQDAAVDLMVETQPDNIAWLLNVRGNDVTYNPIPHSFLLVEKTGGATWFVNAAKFEDGLAESLPNSVTVKSQPEFLATLAAKARTDSTVWIDPEASPTAVLLTLQKAAATPLRKPSALTKAKAVKNATELSGMQECQVHDGLAMTRFSAWLHREVPARAAKGNPVTEREAEEKAQFFRAASADYIYDSFAPISAAAGNAAMCHYAATEACNAPILDQQPYLLDSGAQYVNGTTDVTRSFAFGSCPEGYERAYTAVFKAFVALATLRFPKGTQGHHIDAICRRPLWDLGLDYDHGTGHGIGHSLSVHEQPQRIGKAYNPVDLLPGMVMSIEPGHYVADSYGIRIENLFEIVAADDGFMEFRNITLIPIQTDMMHLKDLSDAELRWLNDYHSGVFATLYPLLDADDPAAEWLKIACRNLIRP